MHRLSEVDGQDYEKSMWKTKEPIYRRTMGEKKDNYEGYFDYFIGNNFNLNLLSWSHDFTGKSFGPEFMIKTSISEIRQVKQNR
jgi:hypothetical protein